MNQEEYLSQTSLKAVILRGIKKIITEMTSVKFLLLCYICFAIPHQWISETVGMGMALVLVSIREIPAEIIGGLIAQLTGGKNNA